MGRAFRILLGLAAALVATLCIVAIVMCFAVIRSAQAQEDANRRADERRVVAIDAAQTAQEQQACAAKTNAAALTAIIDAVLAGARSDEELVAALDQLRPVREQLATVASRCFDDNPVPGQPAEAGP